MRRPTYLFLADAASSDSNTTFLQSGAIGLILIIALAAVRVLYNREVAEHEREKARADRLETQLAELNAAVQSQYVQALADAQKAVADALRQVRSAQRRAAKEPADDE